jgi:hypothetical protein
VKRRDGRMTTEQMEVYSLEEGDQILVGGNIYRIVDIETLNGDSSSLLLIDEEGIAKTLNVPDSAKVLLVCDADHLESA